jgi:predicted HTH domain antitoxin
MEATKRNDRIVRAIINLLAQEKVSVKEASEILRFVIGCTEQNATVQPVSE